MWLLPKASLSRSGSPTARSIAPDDVVDPHHLRLARLYPDFGQHWHQTLSERVELLARVPDLADPEVAIGCPTPWQYDIGCLWVRRPHALEETFTMTPEYLTDASAR
jgi:hypothetical protein